VETPGTAPGSDPLITSAFMSIVPLPEQVEHRGFGSVLKGEVLFGYATTDIGAGARVEVALGSEVDPEKQESDRGFNHEERHFLTGRITVGHDRSQSTDCRATPCKTNHSKGMGCV